MKLTGRILIGAGCFALLLVSWIIAIGSRSAGEKQLDLIRRAAELTKDGIYIRAIPILEEAARYNAEHTPAAEEDLKKAYLELMEKGAFRNEYINLLQKQMNRKNTGPEPFAEAARYYLSISRVQEALEALKNGIAITGSDALVAMYEGNRYAYRLSRSSFDNVTAPCGSAIQVEIGGLWGIAGADGILMIPCEYEKISTFNGDRAVAMKNNETFAIDRNNFRIAKLNANVTGLGNFADDRIPVQIDGVWLRASGDLILGTAGFQEIGMYSEGYTAAKVLDKWGVVDLDMIWLLPAEYDGIIQDELGQCYAQGAVFARKGDEVYLYVGGNQAGDSFEDARPFSAEGYAAVKRGGLWGFIDINGNVAVDFKFEDALSFGQHLAAVKQGGLWGYIGLSGGMMIEPEFIEAKSFSDGSAAVLTERGWQFIILEEYVKKVGL